MLKYVVRSHPGCIRKKNEDCFYVPADSGPPVFAVADGMGGHVAGEIASAAAVQTLEKNIPFFKQDLLASDQGEVRAFFEQIILEANENILNMQLQEPELKGMGTTFTAAAFFDGNKLSAEPVEGSRQPRQSQSPEPAGRSAVSAGPVDGSRQPRQPLFPKPAAGRCAVLTGHVGDSQLHLFNKAGHTQITEDHSVVMELLKNGEIKADEIYTHPQRNFLTRALGTGPALKVDFYTAEIVPGDYIVLCTDGLTAMLRPQEIGKIILQGPDLETAADALIGRANALGGLDNITFVLINYLER